VNWGIDLLTVLGPAIVPRAQEVNLDARVFAFMALAVAVISIGFGLVAARPVSKLDLNEFLRSTRTGVPRRHWSDVLVVAEVSLAVLLLVGSGLLAKSLWRLQQTNPGITAEELLSVEFDLSATTYGDAVHISDFYRRLVTRMQTLAGVQSVSF